MKTPCVHSLSQSKKADKAPLMKNNTTYGALRMIVFFMTVFCMFTLLSGCSANQKVNQALNASDSVSELHSMLNAISHDNYLKNASSSERDEYQGLFDAIPKKDFSVEGPYLIYSDKNYQMGNNDGASYYLIHYSGEEKNDESVLESAKTLIFVDPTYAGTQVYNKVSGQGQNMGGTGVYTYSLNIYYYDVATKTIIGFDKLAAPPFPKELSRSVTGIKPSDEEAVDVIEKRIEAKD